MTLLQRLQKNKGTVSSALGKELGAEIVAGNHELLKEAVVLTLHDPENPKGKNVRAGAAKTVQMAAEKAPELVAPYLPDLLPALKMPEPQTRWIILHTFAYCAALNPAVAAQAFDDAVAAVREQNGVCLSGSAEIYLGSLGALSEEQARRVFPVLIEAFGNALPNEVDWILEAFISIAHKLSPQEKQTVLGTIGEPADDAKKSTAKRYTKLKKSFGV